MSHGNLHLAASVIEACARVGVREFVLCAGARNAPLVKLLDQRQSEGQASEFKTFSFFEERSAAFFALGRMQASGRPVAVITTSGTAVAELLPATIEAHYQGLPLLLLTADRPKRYRGCGAPQTIVQTGMFSHYVEHEWDLEAGTAVDLATWSRLRPLHVNVCFEEPNPPPEAAEKKTTQSTLELSTPFAIHSFRQPLVIVAGLSSQVAPSILSILKTWQQPVYAEAASQLRGQLGDLEILEASIARLPHDGVIRIGTVPTLRYWRDLENSDIPVAHFSDLPFSGMPRTQTVFPLGALPKSAAAEWQSSRDGEVSRALQNNTETRRRLVALLEKYPLSEPGWINWISRAIPEQARVFLGNSLPIREWDLAAQPSRAEIFVNRGANGIDGLISTFLGVAAQTHSNWAILGDLSALYDLSGPWALRERPELKDVTLVVINNGGGKIFQRIFNNALFENRHALGFGDWAKMWDWDYALWDKLPTAVGPCVRPRVLEIRPDEEQTAKFWEEWR
ncbi:MAG: 2-succinyl-5-enolpyruvyl-6-hydroxy-3-cyclohexene-1-carboxylic-acid synthase [Bdellovibrionales bacterium]|nr:2-succinyl-5-enolpyruvyl-6-hydroxy-3-cyclohexene-1-carboxylic-acid synthase [Bdellovibrionales bacterium]